MLQSLALPDGLGRQIHQNPLLKMAREGAQMTSRPGQVRGRATLCDVGGAGHRGHGHRNGRIRRLARSDHDQLFSTTKSKDQQDFQKHGKAINDKVRLYSKVGRVLVEAKESGGDPYAAIEAILPRSDCGHWSIKKNFSRKRNS